VFPSGFNFESFRSLLIQNRKNYPAAIQSLQISLRGEPDDQVGWVRLGEAYARAGRHAAAIKALEHARSLRPDDWICSYLIADVQSQTERFTEAITSLQSILDDHPSELGVLVALSTAHLNHGTQELSLGFFARAEVSFLTAIEVAWTAMETNSGFSRVLWKIIADSLFRYSSIQSPGEIQRLSDVLVTLKEILEAAPSIPISKPLVGSFAPEEVSALTVLYFAVATYEYRISFGFHDDKAKASAWYDLGVALQTLRSRNVESHATITQDRVVHCLKEAVSAEPDEESQWIALGNAYFLSNAKSAQHAYIKSLGLNSKVRVILQHSDSVLRGYTVECSYLDESWVALLAPPRS
jgi:superkiller protein 3